MGLAERCVWAAACAGSARCVLAAASRRLARLAASAGAQGALAHRIAARHRPYGRVMAHRPACQSLTVCRRRMACRRRTACPLRKACIHRMVRPHTAPGFPTTHGAMLRPGYGYHHPPMIMPDLMTGLAVAHVLRSSSYHHYHHHRAIAGPNGGATATKSFAADGGGVESHDFYFGAGAYPAGTSIRVSASEVRSLETPHDRYILVGAPIRFPIGGSALVLNLHNVSVMRSATASSVKRSNRRPPL